MATRKGTVEEDLLLEATDSSSAKFRVPKVLFSTHGELLKAVLEEEDYAMFLGFLAVSLIDDYEVLMDFEGSYPLPMAIGLQQDSEFLGIFNYHLLKMMQTGTFPLPHLSIFPST